MSTRCQDIPIPDRSVRLAEPALARALVLALALAVLLLGGFATLPTLAANPGPALLPVNLQVAFTRCAFAGVNRNDAEAAFKVFTRSLGRKRGYDVSATMRVFEDVADLEPRVLAGEIDLVIVDSWRFLAMNIAKVVTPHFVTADQDQPGKRYLLLTRKDSRFRSLDDLRGQELLEIEISNASLAQPWLETLLHIRGLGTRTTFFGRSDIVNKGSAAILPVFFGRKPACLVDDACFAVMRELNPQVGTTLQPVVESEPYVDGVICLRNEGWASPDIKDLVLEALATLPDDATGRQVLMLFKIGRLLPYQPSQLDTVRNLRTQAGQTPSPALAGSDTAPTAPPPRPSP